MAIQIPTLKKIGPLAPEQTTQIEDKVPDGSKLVAQQSGAVGKLATGIADLTSKFEDDAIDVAATKAAMEYEVKYKTELQKAKNWDDDPTPVYTKFDEDSNDWQNEIMEKYGNASDRMKSGVQQKLLKKHYELADQRGISEAMQFNNYQTKVTNSAVKLEIDGALDAAEVLKMNDQGSLDEDSLIDLTRRINNIKDLRIKSGQRTGLVRMDEKGNEVYSPSLKVEIKKDVSDALQNVITTLNARGNTDVAEAIQQRFSDDLTSDTKVKLSEHTKNSKIDHEAMSYVMKASKLPPTEAMSMLESQIKDPVVLDKAMMKLDAYQSRLQRAKDKESKNVYESMVDVINGASKSGKPFENMDQFESSPVAMSLNLGEKLSGKQYQALKQLIEVPSESKPEAKGKAYDSMFKNEFQGMSFGDFNQLMVGVSKKDRAMFEKRWNDDNSATPGEKTRIANQASQELERSMLTAKLIKRDYTNRLDNKNQIKLNEARDEMMQFVDSLPPTASPKDINMWVKDFVTKKAKGEAFNPPPPPKFQGTVEKIKAGEPPPETKGAKTFLELTKEEQQKTMMNWKNKYGSPWDAKKDGKAALQKFINEGGSK